MELEYNNATMSSCHLASMSSDVHHKHGTIERHLNSSQIETGTFLFMLEMGEVEAGPSIAVSAGVWSLGMG